MHRNGNDIVFEILCQTGDEATALYVACMLQFDEVVKVLKRYGARDVNGGKIVIPSTKARTCE